MTAAPAMYNMMGEQGSRLKITKAHPLSPQETARSGEFTFTKLKS